MQQIIHQSDKIGLSMDIGMIPAFSFLIKAGVEVEHCNLKNK
jgi:hypothetical protein